MSDINNVQCNNCQTTIDGNKLTDKTVLWDFQWHELTCPKCEAIVPIRLEVKVEKRLWYKTPKKLTRDALDGSDICRNG